MKNEIIKIYHDAISNSFVDEFEKIDHSRIIINEQLEEMGIEYRYSYNDFCKDFLEKSQYLLDQLNVEQLQEMNSVFYMTSVLKEMIYNKSMLMIEKSIKNDEIIGVVNSLKNNFIGK